MSKKLVLLRHGQSQWNLENRFTGWVDVDLSDKGVEEAKNAGQLLLQEGIRPEVAYTSVLKRAIRTLWIGLDELDRMWIPVNRSWRLNERHYGELQGLDKAETTEKHGEEQVLIWRRSYDTPPPLMTTDNPQHPRYDEKYARVNPDDLPGGESLKLTLERVLPYWEERILPDLEDNDVVLVCAHGNSLRALVKHLDGISDEDILKLNIPTGIPLIYHIDEDFKAAGSYYLGDEEAAKAAAEAVAKQASSQQ